jgi:hypothetical protein
MATELFLHLFHGRTHPYEDMDDWGFDGPSLGPLNYVHTTYGNHVRVCFTSADAELKFFPQPAQYPDSQDIVMVDDMLAFNGAFYGDWSAHIHPIVTP